MNLRAMHWLSSTTWPRLSLELQFRVSACIFALLSREYGVSIEVIDFSAHGSRRLLQGVGTGKPIAIGIYSRHLLNPGITHELTARIRSTFKRFLTLKKSMTVAQGRAKEPRLRSCRAGE